MNKNVVEIICAQYNLGQPTGKQQQLHGGLLHKIWKFETDLGVYVAKEINPHITIQETFPKSYELSESIANKFLSKNLPAIAAIKHQGRYVCQIQEGFFIIYPYVQGQIIDAPDLNESHAKKIGHIFAKIHNLKLQIDEIEKPQYHLFTNEHWEKLISDCGLEPLQSLKSCITGWNDRYNIAISNLDQNLVVTHGDLHYKNVLWDNKNEPYIIDWESVGYMNPIMEVIGYGIEWSGILYGYYNNSITSSLISEYAENRKYIKLTDIDDAFYGWLGHCVLGWTEFNIRRMMGKTSESYDGKNLGKDIIITKMIPALNYLYENQDNISQYLKNACKGKLN